MAAQNHFLACCCYPEADIEAVLPGSDLPTLEATVSSVKLLSADILGISLTPSRAFDYRGGQFINLFIDEHTSRPYSLASVPELDDRLLLHVRKVPGGRVSGWIFENLKAGDVVRISEAKGNCFYVSENPDQSLLLIATGSGLAPLYCIARDALAKGHTGCIRLCHGSTTTAGLYLVDELVRLAKENANFHYTPCLSECEAPPGYARGNVLDVALSQNPDLSGWRVYLCGHPELVGRAKTQTFLAGASMREIVADPF